MRYLLLLLLCTLPGLAEDVLPGTYQVRYWGLGEGRSKPPGTDESLSITAQGKNYLVVWTMPDGTKLPGIGIRHQDTLAVAYVDKGEPGLIVYRIQLDDKSVRLTDGLWTIGLKATEQGHEELSRPR